MIKCFWIEPTGRARRWLRRYAGGTSCAVEGNQGYHQVLLDLDVCEEILRETHYDPQGPDVPKDDPRWPTHCACGFEFLDSHEKQVFSSHLYRRPDTGEEMTLRDAPPGAMWDGFWWPRKGPDGKFLIVRLPGDHDWCIDGPCNNCPWKDGPEHQCWVRHGVPPDITVDKGGNSCPVGAGSVLAGSYHAMLENGFLRPV